MRIFNTLLIVADAFIISFFLGAMFYIQPAVKMADALVYPYHATDNVIKEWSFAFDNPDGFTEPYDIQAVLGYRVYQPTYNPMYDRTEAPVSWQFVGVK